MVCPGMKKKGKSEESKEDYQEMYKECFDEVQKLDTRLVF